MSEEAGFLKAIAKNPKDKTARLVFADWLQERDDPRAAWIRDDELWEVMKPDAKDPTQQLLAALRRKRDGGHLLGRMGPTVVPVLLEALRVAKPTQIYPLEQALAEIGPGAEPALPVLLAAGTDAEKRVRLGAVSCVAGLIATNEEALALVVATLDDTDDDVRQTALNALHDAGPVAVVAVPKLVELVRGADLRPHHTSLAILANLDALDDSLIPRLVSLLSAGQGGNAVSIALGKMGVPAARAILAAAKAIRGNSVRAAADVLQRIGRDAIPILREALASPHPDTRQLASSVLAKLSEQPDSDSVPGIIEALKSPDRVFRENAFRSIQKLGPVAAPALPALLELVSDEGTPSDDRSEAARAIGCLGPVVETVVPTLLRLIGRKESFLPTWLSFALDAAGHGPSGVLVLLNASRSLRQNEYDWVAQNLHNLRDGTSGDLHGLRDVVLRAYPERTVASTLASTLVEPARLAVLKRTAKTVPAIRAFLDDDSPATRVVAVWALRHVATADAVAALLAALKDKDKLVRTHAVRALAKVGAGVKGVEEAVRAALKDRATDVRDAATKALAALTSRKD